jgi:sensor histidine kinase YesM
MKLADIRKFFLILAGNRIVQHVLFWMVSFTFLVNFFATSPGITGIDFIYTSLFHISLAAAVYINIFILIPLILRKGSYILYLVSVLTLIFLAALLNRFTFNNLVDIILPGYYFISYYALEDILKFVFVYVALTSLLKLSKGWFMLMEADRKLLLIEKEKTATELQALKSQVNPHFLFNSLNNIYSLSLSGSPRTPEVILRLSDLMRYMLYESNEPFVPIDKELTYLKNYIELQKIRSGAEASISYDFSGTLKKQKVAPLLFLPFIENGFKHGIKAETKGGFMNIRISLNDNELYFSVENNKGQVDEVEMDAGRGIGLQNAKRRLELIYPGKHTLDIEDKDLSYKVELKLLLS